MTVSIAFRNHGLWIRTIIGVNESHFQAQGRVWTGSQFQSNLFTTYFWVPSENYVVTEFALYPSLLTSLAFKTTVRYIHEYVINRAGYVRCNEVWLYRNREANKSGNTLFPDTLFPHKKIHYEMHSRGRSSPNFLRSCPWLFESAKRPDDKSDYCLGSRW